MRRIRAKPQNALRRGAKTTLIYLQDMDKGSQVRALYLFRPLSYMPRGPRRRKELRDIRAIQCCQARISNKRMA